MSEPEMIKSRNEMFEGEMVEKPRLATLIYDAKGEPMYRCPNCGNVESPEGCDCLGAEPDCLFCNQCHHEFEIP